MTYSTFFCLFAFYAGKKIPTISFCFPAVYKRQSSAALKRSFEEEKEKVGWTTAKTMKEEEKAKFFSPIFSLSAWAHTTARSLNKKKTFCGRMNIFLGIFSLIYLESSALSFRNESQLENVVPIRSSKRSRTNELDLTFFWALIIFLSSFVPN